MLIPLNFVDDKFPLAILAADDVPVRLLAIIIAKFGVVESVLMSAFRTFEGYRDRFLFHGDVDFGVSLKVLHVCALFRLKK